MSAYDDGGVRIDEDGITLTSFLWPGRSRTIRFEEIIEVDVQPIGRFTGRHQLVGVGPFRPRAFFHWDRRRAKKTHAVVLDRDRFFRLAITPDDAEAAARSIRAHRRSD